MFSKLFCSVPLAAFALLWTAPASAQPASDSAARATPPRAVQVTPAGVPSICRVVAWTSGGPCGGGSATGYARQGGQFANAIMFFGGSGVQLVPAPPNAMRTSTQGGAAVRAATFSQPVPRPEFGTRLTLY